ncbi:DUF6620 family protein [Flavobacterium ardleyense]|uniref:DUF6620 family protein n=1 Tax=Flavobacterium ardleyense TaxID=2038737 RepID=A0ABW5Z8E4_9FLAO
MSRNESGQETTYNPETLHGTHYTIEAFNDEVDRLVQEWIDDEEEANGETPSASEIDNVKFNYRRDVYVDWTGADSDQMLQWEMVNSLEFTGYATSGFVKEENDNPLLEPIHGLSLRDYAAMVIKMSSGVDENEINKAMGIEPAIWQEVNTLWVTRMQEDPSFTIAVLYGQYFMEGATHPKLAHLQPAVNEAGAENLQKMRTDQYFFEELSGARIAAYNYGLDGAQWILDNYGVTLGDFQAVAMEYMTARNMDFNSEEIMKFATYQQEKQAEYEEKFAAEQGGNVADDVDF